MHWWSYISYQARYAGTLLGVMAWLQWGGCYAQNSAMEPQPIQEENPLHLLKDVYGCWTCTQCLYYDEAHLTRNTFLRNESSTPMCLHIEQDKVYLEGSDTTMIRTALKEPAMVYHPEIETSVPVHYFDPGDLRWGGKLYSTSYSHETMRHFEHSLFDLYGWFYSLNGKCDTLDIVEIGEPHGLGVVYLDHAQNAPHETTLYIDYPGVFAAEFHKNPNQILPCSHQQGTHYTMALTDQDQQVRIQNSAIEGKDLTLIVKDQSGRILFHQKVTEDQTIMPYHVLSTPKVTELHIVFQADPGRRWHMDLAVY